MQAGEVREWWRLECRATAFVFASQQPQDVVQVQDRLQHLSFGPESSSGPPSTLYQSRMKQLAERLSEVLEATVVGADETGSMTPPLHSEAF